jgi:ABC-type branched-subunit amino acid transport system ATPase component
MNPFSSRGGQSAREPEPERGDGLDLVEDRLVTVRDRSFTAIACITLVPEGRLVFPRLSVLENLQLGLMPIEAKRSIPPASRVFLNYSRAWQNAKPSWPVR